MKTTESAPSPVPIFELITAYQRSALIRAAIELDIFTIIAKGATQAKAIGQAAGAAERGIRILCDSLTVEGMLEKRAGHYHLTRDAAVFLDRQSPACMGSMVKFLQSELLEKQFAELTESVRNGGRKDEGTVSPDNPVWVEFARSMAPMMAMPAQLIARHLKSDAAQRVLDIAAGHGLFGATLAQQNRQAQIFAVDWPQVLNVAAETAKKMGVQDRFHKMPGSAFEVDFGKDYDVVLFTNFLHHFDHATCVSLLRKAHVAMKAGGRVAILEFVPNPDRVTPPPAAFFSLIMLATTQRGDAYTFPELETMLKEAGFRKSSAVALDPSPETLVLGTK